MTSGPLGVGTDLVTISRIAKLLERRGPQFVRRILSDEELESGVRGLPEEANQIAKCFAAKEAVAKSLGTGFREGVSWKDISISRDPLGAPVVALRGGAERRMAALGGHRVLLSLSDEGDHVLAFAVLT